jgi:DNA-binding transcriptional LysR family regulator
MPSAPGTPTLDQLHVFVQVVDAGSFTGAARKMNRALSVISYTISNLEAQLGVSLFDRTSSRRPQLTEAGRVVLAEARLVAGGIGNLRAKVAGMLQGLEGELHVVLDCLLPTERVVDALTAFRDTYPSVALFLHGETLGAVAGLVLNRTAAIGISGPFTAGFDELHRIGVGSVRMIPVAGRLHPLATVPAGGHLPGAIQDHVQLVIYDRSPLTKGRDFSVISRRTWRLADLYAKHMLLRAGIGWGMMPLAMVKDDLAAGVLVELSLPDGAAFDYSVDAIYRADTPPGPAACWLIERFRSQECG